MNLDSLYAELTLKTKAKLALLVLDGLGDLATREQGYLTPLEAAHTPNLDALSKDSAQCLARKECNDCNEPAVTRGPRATPSPSAR